MNLNRRQVQFLDDRRVLNRKGVINRPSLQPFGRKARACDRRSTTERLELCILDNLRLGIDFDLKFHYVAALRSTDKAGADAWVFFIEAAYISRIIVVVYNLV